METANHLYRYRSVGSNGAFTEHAEVPKDLPVEKVRAKQAKPEKKRPSPKIDSKASRSAALAFEREQKRREMERRKQEDTRENERKRREQAIATAERALQEAKREHETKIKKIEKDRAALDRRSQAENARWDKQKKKLEAALRRATG